jgi:hypothetical protein
VLTRYGDCDAALRHRGLGKAREPLASRLDGGSADEHTRRGLSWMRRTMLFSNPPDHTRLRRLVSSPAPSGNRDPDRFTEPDRFDVTRDEGAHLAFAAGIHFCPGAHLARLEAAMVLTRMLERFGRIELASDPQPRPGLNPRACPPCPWSSPKPVSPGSVCVPVRCACRSGVGAGSVCVPVRCGCRSGVGAGWFRVRAGSVCVPLPCVPVPCACRSRVPAGDPIG